MKKECYVNLLVCKWKYFLQSLAEGSLKCPSPTDILVRYKIVWVFLGYIYENLKFFVVYLLNIFIWLWYSYLCLRSTSGNVVYLHNFWYKTVKEHYLGILTGKYVYISVNFCSPLIRVNNLNVISKCSHVILTGHVI